uniref:Uncharacterized protein n=1 Tax=Picea glauca TaxID=3330 RepID=A0A101LWT9_PICGL|nr:hypothetical protein ABT39_MTgene6250 [Picea glauca]
MQVGPDLTCAFPQFTYWEQEGAFPVPSHPCLEGPHPLTLFHLSVAAMP